MEGTLQSCGKVPSYADRTAKSSNEFKNKLIIASKQRTGLEGERKRELSVKGAGNINQDA
jgi:hypothetical protein